MKKAILKFIILIFILCFILFITSFLGKLYILSNLKYKNDCFNNKSPSYIKIEYNNHSIEQFKSKQIKQIVQKDKINEITTVQFKTENSNTFYTFSELKRTVNINKKNNNEDLNNIHFESIYHNNSIKEKLTKTLFSNIDINWIKNKSFYIIENNYLPSFIKIENNKKVITYINKSTGLTTEIQVITNDNKTIKIKYEYEFEKNYDLNKPSSFGYRII